MASFASTRLMLNQAFVSYGLVLENRTSLLIVSMSNRFGSQPRTDRILLSYLRVSFGDALQQLDRRGYRRYNGRDTGDKS